MFLIVVTSLLYLAVQLAKFAAFAGAGVGGFLIAADLAGRDKDDSLTHTLFKRLGMLGLITPALYIVIYAASTLALPQAIFPALRYLIIWCVSAAAGVAGALVFLRLGTAILDRVKNKLTRKTDLERNRKTDVREIDKVLPASIGSFDPRKFFEKNLATADRLFVGLDEHKKPVYVAYDDWKISHVLLTGRTRSGKGVAAQILLSQAIARGEYTVILDPKGDNWMPHIYKAACEEAGLPWRFLDLRQSAPAQTNLFANCDVETLENMLVGGFSLTEKGEAADFYRLADRKAARRAAKLIADNNLTPAQLLQREEAEVWIERAPAFYAYIQEMAELAPVCRADGQGIDVAEGVQSGGVLYVVGDMINPRIIRMQRMILLRLLFLAKNRDQINQGRTITVFADEFKVHISRPFMTSLGASAGWGLHSILAFQSLQDLADCPADLDKDSVRGSVMENCGIQLSYAIKDPETAEWLAASTGTILVDDESRQVRKNLALAESVDNDRTIRQAERYHIDTNMLMRMPKGCGVLGIAGSLSAFCYTSPVPAERSPAATTPTAPPQASAEVAATPAAALRLDLDDESGSESELTPEQAPLAPPTATPTKTAPALPAAEKVSGRDSRNQPPTAPQAAAETAPASPSAETPTAPATPAAALSLDDLPL